MLSRLNHVGGVAPVDEPGIRLVSEELRIVLLPDGRRYWASAKHAAGRAPCVRLTIAEVEEGRTGDTRIGELFPVIDCGHWALDPSIFPEPADLEAGSSRRGPAAVSAEPHRHGPVARVAMVTLGLLFASAFTALAVVVATEALRAERLGPATLAVTAVPVGHRLRGPRLAVFHAGGVLANLAGAAAAWAVVRAHPRPETAPAALCPRCWTTSPPSAGPSRSSPPGMRSPDVRASGWREQSR